MTSSDDWLNDWADFDEEPKPKTWHTAEPDEREIVQPPFPLIQALDFNESDLPPRPWIVPYFLMRGAMTLLVGAGGAGKSLFSLQMALSIAAGRDFGGFWPRDKARCLILNQEDDAIEQRRRLAAIRHKLNITAADVADRLLIPANNQEIIAAITDRKTGTTQVTETLRKLAAYVKDAAIDVLIIDPFAETMTGSENDVEGVRGALRAWRDDIAKACDCAVLLVHHTPKNASGMAGDANAARGSTAINAAVRSNWTVFPMSEDDAQAVGIDQADRFKYLRVDDAKANYGLLSGTARWFEKHEVQLENGNEDIPGDKVGVLMPWTPPGAFDGVGLDTIKGIIKDVTSAFDEATPYKFGRGAKKGGERCLIDFVASKTGKPDKQAERMIRAWFDNGVLVKESYRDPERREDRSGITGRIGMVG